MRGHGRGDRDGTDFPLLNKAVQFWAMANLLELKILGFLEGMEANNMQVARLYIKSGLCVYWDPSIKAHHSGFV